MHNFARLEVLNVVRFTMSILGDTSPVKSVDDMNLPENGLHAQFYQPPANLNTQELQFKRIIEKKYNVQLGIIVADRLLEKNNRGENLMNIN